MGRPFHFKLEKILEYRQQAEDQAKMALAQARSALAEQEKVLKILHSDLRNCLERISCATSRSDLWLYSEWRKGLESDLQEAERKQAELETLVEECRLALVARTTERKLLEKLRAKQAQHHAWEEQRKEQNDFDETATLRYGRTSY